jgi:opacity protein-like surface antigen
VAALAGALLCPAASVASAAGDADSHWRYGAGFAAGFHVMDTIDHLDEYGVVPSEGAMVGWNFIYRFHYRWGIEAGWMGSFSKAEVKGGTAEADVDPMYLYSNIVFFVPTSQRIDPFLTIGAGMSVLDVDRDGVGDSENNISFNYGGGIQVALNHRFAVTAEFRDYVYDIDGISKDTAEALGLSEDFDEALNDIGILFGLMVTF